MFLYHYFDKSVGPFFSLSDIPIDEAKVILNRINKEKPNAQSAHRQPTYMEDRAFPGYLVLLLTFLTTNPLIQIVHTPGYLYIMFFRHLSLLLLWSL